MSPQDQGPGRGEPPAGPWRVEPFTELVRLLTSAPIRERRPRIVAVDGRGGGGKSTLAERLRAAIPAAAVVHTDDIAWWHSRFDWADLMRDGVLGPLHRGEAIRFQPPAWEPRGRTGFIEIPANTPLVVIEGVGASRRELTKWIDAAAWIQSDFAEAERRGIARDGGDADATKGWHEWMAEEIPFLEADRPWERADVIVAGTPDMEHDPLTQVVLAPPQSTRSVPATA